MHPELSHASNLLMPSSLGHRGKPQNFRTNLVIPLISLLGYD